MQAYGTFHVDYISVINTLSSELSFTFLQ